MAIQNCRKKSTAARPTICARLLPSQKSLAKVGRYVLISAYANLRGNESLKGESDGLRVELLRDIREVLREQEDTNIFSQDLTASLCRMSDRPWHELIRGKEISSTWLAKQLKTFRIISKSVRVGDNSKKGYRVGDFHDAFERYS